MSKSANKITREERLAQKLRENLRRRKVQTKAMAETPSKSEEAQAPEGGE